MELLNEAEMCATVHPSMKAMINLLDLLEIVLRKVKH